MQDLECRVPMCDIDLVAGNSLGYLERRELGADKPTDTEHKQVNKSLHGDFTIISPNIISKNP